MLADQCEVAAATEAEANQWRDEYLKAYARQLLREHPDGRHGPRAADRPLPAPHRATRFASTKTRRLEQYRDESARRIRPRTRSEVEVTQRRSDLDQSSRQRRPVGGRTSPAAGREVSDERRSGIRSYIADVWEAWNEFWFTPTSPSTLSAIRVLAGAMLLYTHLVWSFDLQRLLRPQRLAAGRS